jgi:serine/threonine protein kinase
VTRERWQQITGIFHEALTRETGQRRAFVAARCGNDSSLRRAVESMLDAHDDAGSFGDTPAFAAATSVPDGGALAAVALSAGTRIGPYEVDTLLGVGGMGAVYRARDTKLGREVALKVLLPAVANDPDRHARFGREARLLASLNHPNIAQVHGFEEADGVHALVMELVDGPTLADRIGHRPIAIDEALTIAKQIAEALAAAHEQHVIHRDLKPANIKVRPDGTVKVLDFGLAKLLDGPRDDFSGADSLETRTGIILGTVAYMSPEQARGKPVDRRGDLWAFGCVLFEMLTGRRAFDDETSSDVVAHIIERHPDWQRLPRRIPAPVHNLLKRCLQKDPSKRLDSAAVARFELEDALASPPSGGLPQLPWPLDTRINSGARCCSCRRPPRLRLPQHSGWWRATWSRGPRRQRPGYAHIVSPTSGASNNLQPFRWTANRSRLWRMLTDTRRSSFDWSPVAQPFNLPARLQTICIPGGLRIPRQSFITANPEQVKRRERFGKCRHLEEDHAGLLPASVLATSATMANVSSFPGSPTVACNSPSRRGTAQT